MSVQTYEINTNGKETAFFENKERVYPCRCGVTHRGEYAAYDYGHHNCFHDAPLQVLDRDHPEITDLICSECGLTFQVEP